MQSCKELFLSCHILLSYGVGEEKGEKQKFSVSDKGFFDS